MQLTPIKIMKKVKLTLIVSILLILGFKANAQEKYRYQAMFVYNFTRMTAWPQDYQTGEFVIGVLGNSPIHKEFSDIAQSRQVGSQKIVVKQFNSIEDISKCHIVYVAGSQTRNMSAINQKLTSENIAGLIVTDSRNALDEGAAVNFIMEGDRQRYELSQTNASALGLSLGSEMTRLAANVK